MNRNEKEAIIAELADKASRAVALYFADFSRLTVAEETELRREFRKNSVEYPVAKNTLVRKALERLTGFDGAFDRLAGPTGIAFSYDDPGAPARVIKKFTDKTGKFQLKAAVLEHKVYDGKLLNQLASLPTRKEVVAGILGSLQSPASGIVGAVNAAMRDLVYVIDAIEKKKAA